MKILRTIFLLSLLGVVLIALFLLIWYSPNRPSSVGPSSLPTNTMVPRTVFLSCSECAEEGMLINLWSKPGGLADGAQTVKSFPHGTKCKEIGREGDFLQVICEGYRGWVKITLVNRCRLC